jgi:alkanesulfonate monooxygenase SsuD/methylene tetrahydromethanopterin reductase-like flavin-dependent oxidoreductase (luciferase family)
VTAEPIELLLSSLMTPRMPALSLAASPGKRQIVIDAAVEAERLGFTGVFCPSFGDALGLSLSIADATTTLEIGTSIQPIYFQHPVQLASQAAHLHETSKGRFRLGIGVSHAPVLDRMKVERATPLSDMRAYVAAMRGAEKQVGALPPIVLATMRQKMLDLAIEVADGAVWANAARSAMPSQLISIPADRKNTFFVGDMLPTVIDEDRDAAAAVCRKTLTMYVNLPNYRNYWHDNGFSEEMDAIAAAIERGDRDAIPGLMTERWLKQTTVYGSAAEVREGIEKWFDVGVSTPIVVPSSTSGGQAKALSELFAVFS